MTLRVGGTVPHAAGCIIVLLSPHDHYPAWREALCTSANDGQQLQAQADKEGAMGPSDGRCTCMTEWPVRIAGLFLLFCILWFCKGRNFFHWL